MGKGGVVAVKWRIFQVTFTAAQHEWLATYFGRDMERINGCVIAKLFKDYSKGPCVERGVDCDKKKRNAETFNNNTNVNFEIAHRLPYKMQCEKLHIILWMR